MITSSDIYSRVHKGLRKAMFELAVEAGRTEYGDGESWQRLKTKAAEMIHFLNRHGHVEDTYQLPLLETKIPGITGRDSQDHEQVHLDLARIEEEIARIDGLPADARREAGERFYLLVNAFISDYLGHMHREETITAPLYFQHCTQEDLQGMLASIIANNAPADTMLMLRHTLPSIDPVERATFLGAIRRTAPPQAFEAVMGVARSVLADADVRRLEADLG